MATTCQNVIDRAKQFNPLNASLASDVTELVTRIQQYQQRVFTAIAQMRRPRFTVSLSATSTSGSALRTVNLASLSQPVERILRVTLPSGLEAFQVSEFDINAQLAPRYFIRDKTLYEVNDDWGAAGTVAVNVLFAQGATPITTTGGSNQLLSVPDEWMDVIILPLARYFHQKDPGRDPSEYQNLTAQYVAAWNQFLAYLTNYGGDATRTELLPGPPEIRAE